MLANTKTKAKTSLWQRLSVGVGSLAETTLGYLVSSSPFASLSGARWLAACAGAPGAPLWHVGNGHRRLQAPPVQCVLCSSAQSFCLPVLLCSGRLVRAGAGWRVSKEPLLGLLNL